MLDYRELIRSILNIIDFAEDKEEFISDFMEQTQRNSLLVVLNSLPAGKKDSVKIFLEKNPTDFSPVREIVNAQFSEAELDYFYDSSFRQAVTDFLQPRLAALSKDQQDQLVTLFDASFPTTPHLDSEAN